MSSTNDNGVTHIQRLDPNQIDVVLGSARTPRSTSTPRQKRSSLWPWLLAAIAGAGWWWSSEGPDAVPPVIAAAPNRTLPAPAPVPAVVNQTVATRLVNQVVIINPPPRTATARPAASVEPAAVPAPAQGMVSASYLARFKSGANRPETPAQRPYQIASVTIREWDGPNRYVAKWRIEDNQIDQGSVCFNFAPESIGHRECRRAAQQYFQNQCKDWTRRAEKTRDRETREAKGQYCAVAGEFVP